MIRDFVLRSFLLSPSRKLVFPFAHSTLLLKEVSQTTQNLPGESLLVAYHEPSIALARSLTWVHHFSYTNTLYIIHDYREMLVELCRPRVSSVSRMFGRAR
jgi:hypothetical protein